MDYRAVMRLLITGGSGFLGTELARQSLAAGHEVVGTFMTRPGPSPDVHWRGLDIRDRPSVLALVTEIRPDLIIHTAFRQSDWATTADGAAHVALAADGVGAHLVHVSSDAVFSGKAVNYDETAVPDPINSYGAAKAAAETAVNAIKSDAVVVRTSLIIGDGGSVHETRVHALTRGEPGVLFTDDVRCAVHVVDLASALLELGASERTGIFHVAGADPVSRHELGVLIARRDGLDENLLRTGLRAESPVGGPLDVRLNCAKSQRFLTTRLRGAREFLKSLSG